MSRKTGIWIGLACLVAAGASSAFAAGAMKFWNLTSQTITELKLAPVGTDKWGANQCLNDDDKSVEADERLTLKDLEPGHYDVKFKDRTGRSCTVKNVEVKAGGPYAFSIEEGELKGNCAKK